jgi:hypothetical protein
LMLIDNDIWYWWASSNIYAFNSKHLFFIFIFNEQKDVQTWKLSSFIVILDDFSFAFLTWIFICSYITFWFLVSLDSERNHKNFHLNTGVCYICLLIIQSLWNILQIIQTADDNQIFSEPSKIRWVFLSKY